MFVVMYFIGFLYSGQNSQQAMFNFEQVQIVSLAHFKHLQGLGESLELGKVCLK